MRIIFSRDRAAQLDLLLGSLARNADPEETVVLYRATTPGFAEGYKILRHERPEVRWRREQDFEPSVRRLLSQAGEYVTFLCDDDVLFGPADTGWVDHDPAVLCFSWRLGRNTVNCYPSGMVQIAPDRLLWKWETAEGDFSYPGSLDGHVFRTLDVAAMLEGCSFGNPTELEDALMGGCHRIAEMKPCMACLPNSILCSIPINRVSEQSQVRYGTTHPASAAELNERFLQGWRVDYDALDFTRVDSAHYEFALGMNP